MRMLYEVNRLLLTQGQRFHIEQMIKAFEACYKMGKRPGDDRIFICHRLERLRQYANCGFIDNEHDKRYFIAACDEASRLATTLDGWIERSANNAPTPHDCVAYYPE